MTTGKTIARASAGNGFMPNTSSQASIASEAAMWKPRKSLVRT